MPKQGIPPVGLRWGSRFLRLVEAEDNSGELFATTGEPGFILVLTPTRIGYFAALENRARGIKIKGEAKVSANAAVASVRHLLNAIRRAS